MFQIGTFSKIAQVSGRLLRYYDEIGLLSPEAIEGYRRSAAMAPLPPTAVAELLETAAELARRQREIAKALHSLQSRWPAVRHALNDLSKLTGYE